MYKAYICEIKNVRRHPNADRLDLADCFGNTVCIGHGDFADGDLVVYFPTDGQLSEEFCRVHDLVRRKDDAGNQCGGYLEPGKRNIRAIRLRGERSDGLVMPLTCLEYTGVDVRTLEAGFAFTAVNGKEICQKYIPRGRGRAAMGSGNRTRKRKINIAPLFAEHADTEQLAYNLGAFRPGDEIEITLKMHGTSQRTGYLPMLKGYRRTLFDRILRREGTPIYDWGYVSGTRRTVLENYEGGYYGDNSFREQHSKIFEGKLWKGETVYYEVVGFTDTGAPIMATSDNKKLNDKEFIKQYGPQTIFSYGCEPTGSKTSYGRDDFGYFALVEDAPKSAIYVYRMTMTNPDGEIVEYTPDFMRYRCEQMGVKTVPVFDHFILHDYDLEMDEREPGEIVKYIAEKYYQGPDPIGKTHTREGVVVRIINRPKFCAYKHKNFEFKVLEGIIKNSAEAPDMEEAQECQSG